MEREMEKFSTAYLNNRNVLKDVLPLQIPYCISIEPANICNFKCTMCPLGGEEYAMESKPLMIMEWDCFEKIIEQLKDWVSSCGKVKVIKLYSLGEPLLHESICDMVRAIKDNNICEILEITTNATLLTEEIAKGLVDAGLDYLRVSIYSVLPEQNKKITHNSILPEKIRQNVEWMQHYKKEKGLSKPFVHVKILDRYDEVENTLFLKMYEGLADEAFIDKPFQINNREDVLRDLYHDNVTEVEKDVYGRYIYRERKACRYPFTHLTIKSNGDVVVCCVDWKRATTYGNILENSLESIWNSRELYEFRKMMLETKGVKHPSCHDCELPLKDSEEDNIDGFPLERLTYRKE